MNAISSAAPCHVSFVEHGAGIVRHDVVCWTVDEMGVPVPWIVRGGRLYDWDRLPLHLKPELRPGTAAEAAPNRTVL